MTRTAGRLVGLLFHRACSCGRRVESAWWGPRCGRCWARDRHEASLFLTKGRRCSRCDLPLSGIGSCPDCRVLEPVFNSVRAAGLYAGEWKNRIREYKFENKSALRRPLQRALARRFKGFKDADCVVEVPAAPDRKHPGGHLATELAGALAGTLSLPHLQGALKRKPGHERQSELNGHARHLNAKEAFVCVLPWQVSAKKILLVDDVMTTGATLQACAKSLVAAGTLSVHVAVLARSPRESK